MEGWLYEFTLIEYSPVQVHRIFQVSHTEEEAVAEDEATFEKLGQTVMEIPTDLVPAVLELIKKRKAA